MMAFETVSEATRIWIKGREFSVARLLGDAYKGQFDAYEGGALGIFRYVVVADLLVRSSMLTIHQRLQTCPTR
jgi:hypothetical protein